MFVVFIHVLYNIPLIEFYHKLFDSYFVKQYYAKTEYKVVLLTQNSENERILFPYLYRMPIFLADNTILKWLHVNKFKPETLDKIKMKNSNINAPMAIGKWIDQKINDEMIILKSRRDWELQEEANEIDWKKVIEEYEKSI